MHYVFQYSAGLTFYCTVVPIEESERGSKEEEPVRNSGGSHARKTEELATQLKLQAPHGMLTLTRKISARARPRNKAMQCERKSF